MSKCAILGCDSPGTFDEPRFAYKVCEAHQHLSPVEVSRCASDPWFRVALLGDYPGSPTKTIVTDWTGT